MNLRSCIRRTLSLGDTNSLRRQRTSSRCRWCSSGPSPRRRSTGRRERCSRYGAANHSPETKDHPSEIKDHSLEIKDHPQRPKITPQRSKIRNHSSGPEPAAVRADELGRAAHRAEGARAGHREEGARTSLRCYQSIIHSIRIFRWGSGFYVAAY